MFAARFVSDQVNPMLECIYETYWQQVIFLLRFNVEAEGPELADRAELKMYRQHSAAS